VCVCVRPPQTLLSNTAVPRFSYGLLIYRITQPDEANRIKYQDEVLPIAVDMVTHLAGIFQQVLWFYQLVLCCVEAGFGLLEID